MKSFFFFFIFLTGFTSAQLEYNPRSAKIYAYAAGLAYCPIEKIPKGEGKMASYLTSGNGMKPIHTFSNNMSVNEITYTILERIPERELIVSFSGTKQNEQLTYEIFYSYNVKYNLHPELEGANVVDYFYWYYYHQFRDDFEKTIVKYRKYYSDFRIVFTGHSLGGAMTVHAAIDSILSGWIPSEMVAVYTFGQPRVGNTKFSDVLATNTQEVFRVIHNRDLVAHIPLGVLDFFNWGGYKEGYLPSYSYHFPTEIWYNDDMYSYTVCDRENGEDIYCSNSNYYYSVEDHLNYFGFRIASLYLIDELEQSSPTGIEFSS